MVNVGGWKILELQDEDTLEIFTAHIVPINDIKTYITDASCWCNPKHKENGKVSEGLFTHNSADGREEIEYGRSKPQ